MLSHVIITTIFLTHLPGLDLSSGLQLLRIYESEFWGFGAHSFHSTEPVYSNFVPRALFYFLWLSSHFHWFGMDLLAASL